MPPPLRMLVVDDYEPFRRQLREVLQTAARSLDITEASDGLEAVRKAEALQPDVVLLDIGLPMLNGLQAAWQIRMIAPDARILFTSVESDHDVIAQALRTGARGYVHKPRVSSDLLPALEAVLRGEIFLSPCLADARLVTHRCHEVVFCSHDSTLIDGFARFVASNLKADHAAIVLATEPHRSGIAEWLRRADIDVDGAIQRGSYISLDAAQTLSTILVNGVPDRLLFLQGLQNLIGAATRAATAHHPRVAICGECCGLLCAAGNVDAAIRLEQAGTDLIRAHDIQILCGYPVSRAQNDDDSFARIRAVHTAAHYR